MKIARDSKCDYIMSSLQRNAIQNLLFHCGNLKKSEHALILCDSSTRQMAEAFSSIGTQANYDIKLMEIPPLSNHGAEPPQYAAMAMCKTSLILSLCQYSLAHSSARIEAGYAGARFLSLPLYNWELLTEPCLHIDFKSQASNVRKIADKFTAGKHVHITTAAGTNITLDISERIGNYCPGFVEKPGDLGSPPDIEANVSPIENSSEGIVIIDGSITHPNFGLLKNPVEIKVQNGHIVEFKSEDINQSARLNELFGPLNSARRVLAECGVGLNPAAQLTGTMLTDEGALGCLHFGFGANNTVGGLNKVDFHLDFVFKNATLQIDDEIIILKGIPQI